mgnify:CR=1 FL=1
MHSLLPTVAGSPEYVLLPTPALPLSALGSLNGEEEMLFRAAFRLEAPYTAEQILETLGHLDCYRLPESG